MFYIPGLTTSVLLIAILSLSSSLAISADDYPSRPIKLMVGASPGGTTDTMARAIAPPLASSLGRPVLVENRPGAGGNLAADAVAKSAPDGYTLLVSFTSHTINATPYPKLPFDPVTDFTPISMIATVPSLLVGNPALPAQDLAALIALAKAKPDTLSIAIGGIGSSLHLAGEQLKLMADVRILNVPYKGTAPALTDVLGGQVDMMFISLVTGTAQVRAGKLRAYGVTSAQRQPSFPDLPAIGEIVQGQVGYSPSKYSEEYYRSGQPTGIGVSNNLMGRRRRECASPTVLLAKFSLQSCPVTPQRSVFNGLAAGAPGRMKLGTGC